MFSTQFIKKAVKALYIGAFILLLAKVNPANAQYTLKSYANHLSLERRVTVTEHFKIVYPRSALELVKKVKPEAEQIYEVYENLLGFEPEERITLYIGRKKQFLSEAQALNTADFEPLWVKNPFFECFAGNLVEWKYLLRHEIAYAFQQKIQSSKLGAAQAFLLSSPTIPIWSDGFSAYLSVPYLTQCDINNLSDFWNVQMRAAKTNARLGELTETVLGRSQLLFFNNMFSVQQFERLYDVRKSFLGIEYFDFRDAFLKSLGVPYGFFFNQWRKRQFKIYNDSLPGPEPLSLPDTVNASVNADQPKAVPIESKPYHSFFNIDVDLPVVLPYYLNTDDYGLGAFVSWRSPLRLHKFLFAGVLSIPAIADKSFFYTSYINNSLGPRIKLSFRRFSNASGWLGLNIKRSNIAAISSLSRINSISSDYSNWYIGFMLRHINVDYFSPFLFDNESDIAFDNKLNKQADLRLVLAWRALAPGDYNAIHPLNGGGFRLSVTGSGSFLNDQTQYARFYTEAFTLIPAFGDHRFYLYAAGAYDVNETIGADYLYFSESGNYDLPEPKLIGSTNRSVEAYIRGYDSPLAGERFAWGSVEYRIPLTLNSETLLFGVLPLPKTALALFVDGGVLGDARSLRKTGFTEYRFGLGAEIKTALTFGNFTVVFKTGIAQALDKPFGPAFYFNIQPAIPF